MIKKSKEKKGISLIVLVLTIVVMIILAATIINSLNNNGIIKNASDAVVASDLAHLRTQVEIIKADAQLGAIQNNVPLTQAKLIAAIQKKFQGSTVNGNIITVYNAKYDIMVNKDLSIVMARHGDPTMVKDILVMHRLDGNDSAKKVSMHIKILNAPTMIELNEETSEETLQTIFSVYWEGLDWEEMLVLAVKLFNAGDFTAEQVYASMLQETFGITYTEFKNNPNRDAITKEKTGVDTIEEYVKTTVCSMLLEAEIVTATSLLEAGKMLIYSKDLLPSLATKTADEIETAIKDWYNNKKSIDKITKEVTNIDTFEDFYAGLAGMFGMSVDSNAMFTKQQAMIALAGVAYTATHPVIIEYPNKTKKEFNWYNQTYVTDDSYMLTTAGTYTIKVTGPNGYAEIIQGDMQVKDMEVSYEIVGDRDNYIAVFSIDLLNVPSLRDWNETTRSYFMETEFLNWLDTDGILELGGNIMYPGKNITSQMVYSQLLEHELGMPYDKFMPQKDKVIYDKYSYMTADLFLKDSMVNELDLDESLLQKYALDILYAKDLLPELANMNVEEMIIWLAFTQNIEITQGLVDEIEMILKQRLAEMNSEFGIKDETGYIFSREQVMLIILSEIYANGMIWENSFKAGGSEIEPMSYYQKSHLEVRTYLQDSVHIIKITSPSGYVVEKVVKLPDTTAPTVSVEITQATLDAISAKVTAVETETENLPSGIKEYRYYIKGPSDATYVLKSRGTEPTYKYTGLTSDVEYSIKVEVEDNSGNVGKATETKRIWITAIVDSVPIPKGFVASQATGENTKKGGLVIYEGTAPVTDDNVFDAKRNRNQYVWVPVDYFSKFVRQNFGQSDTISNAITTGYEYWEVILDTITNMPDIEANMAQSAYMTVTTPDGGITNTLAEVQAMYASVKEYKGFYIARYEVGLDVGSHKAEDDGVIIKTVHSKMNKAPYNYVRWTYNNKINEDTNGAVEIARSIYPETNVNYGVVSTLTYGVQWDRTLAWWIETKAKNGTGEVTIESNTQINNSTNYGNHKNNAIPNSTFSTGASVSKDYGKTYTTIDSSYSKRSDDEHLLTTGATEETRVNNIYDMAGNVDEWTMEGHTSYHRILRGGSFFFNGDRCPVSLRNPSGTPFYAANFFGFRSSLYIKR